MLGQVEAFFQVKKNFAKLKKIDNQYTMTQFADVVGQMKEWKEYIHSLAVQRGF